MVIIIWLDIMLDGSFCLVCDLNCNKTPEETPVFPKKGIFFILCISVLVSYLPVQHHLHHCTAGWVNPHCAWIFTERSTALASCWRQWKRKQGKEEAQVKGVRVPQERFVWAWGKQVMWSATLKQVVEDEWWAASGARGQSPAQSRWRRRVMSQGRQLWALSFARASQKWGLYPPVRYDTLNIASKLWLKWKSLCSNKEKMSSKAERNRLLRIKCACVSIVTWLCGCVQKCSLLRLYLDSVSHFPIE